MGIYARLVYKEFSDKIGEARKERASIVLLTVPGMGVSHFIKKYIEKVDGGVKRITGENEDLSEFNFLDLDFDKRGVRESLSLVDEYMKKANLKQKFAVVINTPYVLDGREYKSSYLASHVYDVWMMRVNNVVETADFVEELGVDLTKKDQSRLFELSGGLGRLIKYLAVNKEKWGNLAENKELLRVMDKSLEVIGKTDEKMLQQMEVKGRLLGELLKKRLREKGADIKIERDLSFSEFGEKQAERLTNMEAVLLRALAASNDLLLTRDEIADLKWGEESYEDYSDQAIGKAMRRLEKKLGRHRLVAIPKIGYKLELR